MDLYSLALRLYTDGEQEMLGALRGIGNAGDGATEKLKGVGAAVGALAGVFASLKAVGIGQALVEDFFGAEAAAMRLEGAMQSIGQGGAAAIASVHAAVEGLARTTTIEDAKAQGVLANMIRITQDLDVSTRGLAVAQDMAAATGMSLEAAANLVARAANGQTGALARMGIVVKDSSKALEELEARFRAAGAKEAATFGGHAKQVGVQVGNLREKIGELIAVSIDLHGIFNAVQAVVKFLQTDLGQMLVSVALVAGIIVTAVVAVAGLIAAFVALKAAIVAIGIGALIAGLSMLAKLLLSATIVHAISGLWAIVRGNQAAAKSAKEHEEAIKRMSLEEVDAAARAARAQRDAATTGSDAWVQANRTIIELGRRRRELLQEIATQEELAAERARKAAEAAAEAEKAAFDLRMQMVPLNVQTAASYDRMAQEMLRYAAAARDATKSDEARLEAARREQALRDAIEASGGRLENVRLGSTSRLMGVANPNDPTGTPDSGGTPATPEWQQKLTESMVVDTAALDAELRQSLAGLPAIIVRSIDETLMTPLARTLRIKEQLKDTVKMAVRDGFVGGIVDGIGAAFAGGGLKGAFKAGTAALLRSFGNLLVQYGAAIIAAAPIFTAIAAGLSNIFTAGGASFAYGAALVALGATLGGIASSMGSQHVGGGRGTGGFNQPTHGGYGNDPVRFIFGENSATTAAGMEARPVTNITVIGTNDPRAQREVQELVRNAGRR